MNDIERCRHSGSVMPAIAGFGVCFWENSICGCVALGAKAVCVRSHTYRRLEKIADGTIAYVAFEND